MDLELVQIIVLILVALVICRCGLQIEGFDEQEAGQEGDQEGDQETVEEETLDQAIQAMEESNYLDDNAFQAMAAKGLCTNEPSTTNYHTCEIQDAAQNRETVDLRYVTLPPSTLNTERSHLLGIPFCPQRHPEIMNTLDETSRTYDYSRAGYTPNAYLDRTRFYQSTEPLPINPDFFMDGGGTFA